MADELSEKLKSLIDEEGVVYPTTGTEEEQEAYKHQASVGSEYRCMTCGRDMAEGENPMIVLSEMGVHMTFCSGVCMTDLQINGYLEEELHDLRQAVSFRSQSKGVE